MTAIPLETLVTVFGGSGFLGRHVVRALAQIGYRVRVAVRRPELAGFLQPLGWVGQIHAVQANVRNSSSVEAAARDADVVVNVVGILFERGRQKFDAVQAFGAEAVALAAGAFGARMIHVSALAADEHSSSHYARSKAAGEKLVLAAVPSAVVLRPSILFGPEDDFFNKFASLPRLLPALSLPPCWPRSKAAPKTDRSTSSADPRREASRSSCNSCWRPSGAGACCCRSRSRWRGCRPTSFSSCPSRG